VVLTEGAVETLQRHRPRQLEARQMVGTEAKEDV
jgi:hypothetical protein